MDLGEQVGKENHAKIDQKRQRKNYEDPGSSSEPLEASRGEGPRPRRTEFTANAPGPGFHLSARRPGRVRAQKVGKSYHKILSLNVM